MQGSKSLFRLKPPPGNANINDQSAALPPRQPTEPTSEVCLSTWLESLGLSKYLESFQKAGATISLLPLLTDTNLKDMGITTLGARKKILLAAEDLKENRVSDHSKLSTALARTHGIAAYFPNQQGELPRLAAPPGTIFNYLADPTTALLKLPAKRPLSPVKKPKSGWAHDAARSGTTGKRWKGGARAAAVVPFKSYQLIPGCPGFVVDRFSNLSPTCAQKHWFLTHFHADHYKGLTSKFFSGNTTTQNRGTLYCSPITSALIQQQLRVSKACIREIPLNTPTVIEGVKVTFIDANHCPGAVMILFEPQNRLPILHTGDCRLISAMQQLPVLQAVRGKVDLILDTTYANPQYTFPSQQEVVEFVIDAVKAEAFNGPKTLFLFGSYTIGKERVYLEVARTLKQKVYLSATKKKILDCLEIDAATLELLTTDDGESNMHVVPMWMITQKHMANLLKYYGSRFTTVVGFKPTGWSHSRDTGQTKKRGRRSTIVVHAVPYSEHSSYTELKEFVAWLQPRKITPHVNTDDGGPKERALIALLKS